MRQDILKVVYDYSVAGKILDKIAIEDIANKIIEHNRLDFYISKTEFRNKREEDVELEISEDSIHVAKYCYNSKELIVYSENCIKMLNDLKMYETLFTEFEKYFFRNLTILEVILHEIEHASHDRIIRERDTIVAQILRLSSINVAGAHLYILDKKGKMEEILNNPIDAIREMVPFIKEVQKIYIKNYDCCPPERMAEVMAYKEIIDLVKPIQDRIPNLIEYEQACQLENMIRGYTIKEEMITSPTIHYFKELKYDEELKEFAWYDEDYLTCLSKSIKQYALPDRMTLGLPITEEEKIGVLKVLVKTNRYSINRKI